MPMERKLTETEIIACEICLSEVPASEATSPEAADYVAHFCGLECYEVWKNMAEREAEKEAG